LKNIKNIMKESELIKVALLYNFNSMKEKDVIFVTKKFFNMNELKSILSNKTHLRLIKYFQTERELEINPSKLFAYLN